MNQTSHIVITPAGSRYAVVLDGIAVAFRDTYAAAINAARDIREDSR